MQYCRFLVITPWLIALSLGLLCHQSYAFIPSMGNAGHTGTSQNQLRVKPGKVTCPPISQLYVKHMLWGAKPDAKGTSEWVTFSNSFSKHIKRFLGAHWNGVKVGHILCDYQGDTAGDFTVVLQSSQFALAPDSKHWSTVDKGVANCNRSRISDCPFRIVIEAPDKLDEQDLLNLKKIADHERAD